MGHLLKGIWQESSMATIDESGNFIRADTIFHNKITKNGESGFKAEPDRYHLYISYACPWASRTLIMRALKKLESIISISTVDCFLGKNGWFFNNKNSENTDTVNHKHFLHEIYVLAKSDYTGKVTVPVLWDKKEQTIVNNESAEIIRMLNSEFEEYTDVKYDYYPQKERAKIDEINDYIYQRINNGVYKCGFAKTQEAYDESFSFLFEGLDKVEKILSNNEYLLGNNLTEADWRLFVTLVRFDAVYFGHFKCNLKRISDYPNMGRYLKKLYNISGIAGTVKIDQIKEHYYRSHIDINPTQIVPQGPQLDFMS